MAAQADGETIAAFRELVDRVVIIDAPNNAVEAQVIGRPAALVGANAEKLGGTVVAEVRSTLTPTVSLALCRVA